MVRLPLCVFGNLGPLAATAQGASRFEDIFSGMIRQMARMSSGVKVFG
jgi:hypothetical protein